MTATPAGSTPWIRASSKSLSQSDLGERDYKRRPARAQRAALLRPCGGGAGEAKMRLLRGPPVGSPGGRSMALAVMRRHRRWLFGFLWIVIAAFIILYIPAFQGADAGSPGETMAKVGGLPITVGEFNKARQRQRQRLEQLYQGRLDAEALRSMGIEEQVFNALVDDRLV